MLALCVTTHQKNALLAVPGPTPHWPGIDVPIETKFHAPSSREEWVKREPLIQALAGSAAKLILVDAPAGFGKSTLVAQWRSSTTEERSFAWLSLDDADDDPGSFWWHVVCALQRACPGFGGEAMLRAVRVPGPNIGGTVLPMLVNELTALRRPVVLVLDDYHVIEERSCHGQIAFLLSHLPRTAQLVLITRADPPLPLARLRAAGDVVEFRARDLRFSPAEVAALVHTVSAVQLSEPDLADLHDRTEGWPTGVYLAALSLRGHPSPGAFIRQFTGDNRFIVDFLAEEVLNRQSGEIRQFLMRTAILPRFCAPLCEVVAGSANAAEIIDVLERENLFVVPLDENRQWFRYHHLFAQVLHSQLTRTEPSLVPTLHQRASAWHRVSGSVDEAIGHARATGDVAKAGDLAMGALGLSRSLSGELHQAAETLEAGELGEAPVPLIRILTLSAWSLVAVELGRLLRATELASEARTIATDGDLSETPQSSLASTAADADRAAQGRLDEARGDGAEAPAARVEQLRRHLVALPRWGPGADALTEREMSVLRLLRGTLSLREIGQELYVSPNTIKTHAQAIYRKLSVSTRQDAVAHARDVGIL